MENIKEFVKERNDALLSLDKETLVSFFSKWQPRKKIPEDDNVFWAGVHYARLDVIAFDNSVKSESLNWLSSNGFSS